jgi:hypothetical protein
MIIINHNLCFTFYILHFTFNFHFVYAANDSFVLELVSLIICSSDLKLLSINSFANSICSFLSKLYLKLFNRLINYLERKYSNIQKFKYSNIQIFKYSNIQLLKNSKNHFYKTFNFLI